MAGRDSRPLPALPRHRKESQVEVHTPRQHVVVGAVLLAGGAIGLRRWRQRKPHTSQRVAGAMTLQPVCAEAHESAQAAALRMAEEGVGALAVCHEGRPVGVVTDRDMVLRVLAQAEDPRRITVGDCLEGDIATAGPDQSLDEAAKTMRAHRVRRLPVVRDGRLVGIVTQADLAQHDAAIAGSLERTLARTGADARSAAWLFHKSYRQAAKH